MLCFLPDPRRTTRHTVLLPGIALLVIALAFATGCKVNILFGSSVPTTPPTAVADAFSHPGNSTLTVNAANGLLNNDTGGGLSCTAYSGTGNTTQGGDVAVNADGSFTYTPVAGFTGSDTFSYTVTNSKGSDPTGMCTITVGTLVWYINSSAAGGGTGRDIDPFDSISAFNTADPSNTNQFIYLFTGAGNYTGPIDLKPGQSLIGAGVDLVVDTVTLRTAATRPTIVNPAGNGVTVQANNTVRGVNFGDTPTGAAILNSADATNLVINNVAISGSGRTVRILNTVSSAMTVTIDSLTSTSTTNTALELDGFTGSFTVTGATTLNSSLQGVISIANVGASTTLTFDTISITNRSEFGIVLANFNATATITTGDITLGAVTATPQNALLLDNFDGTATVGTMSLDGDTGTAFLINNGTGGSFTAGDTTLTGANGLDIDTSTGTFTFASLGITSSNGFGIRANSGTVNIVASTTTVSSTNGAAVDLTGTSAGQTNGAAGWTFATLSSTNGAFGFRNNGANSDVTVTGTTTINGSTNTGISIAATTATFIFTGAVTLSTVGDAFVCGTASGDIRFPGGFSGNTITSTTGRGIVATSSNIDITPTNTSVSTKEAALTFNCANVGRLRTNGVSGITFADITQANSSDTGLRITNNIDPVTITGTVSLTTAGNEGMQINNTASAIVFQGTVTVSGAGNSGIRINVAGAAVTFQGAVTVTTSGNGATEAAIAILATAAAGSVTFQGAVSTTNGNTGIGIVASDGSIVFQSDITIGTTVNSGLVISGISATGSFSATGGTIGVSGTDSSNNGTDNNITVNNCAGTVTLESDGGTLVANPIQANVRITGSSGAVTLRGTTSSWTLNNAGTGANDPDHGIAIINSSNVTLENISIGPMGSNDSENAIDISNVPDGATYTITNCV
ncbi:MAG: beta strand repeat-containing protein, partial [Planctomycetota bacterium]